MPRTPVLERSGSLKILGAAFIALMLFFLWLTYAFFNKTFVDSVPVTLTTGTTGVNLPKHADVKLRGMIVGEVRKVEPDGKGVKLSLAMKPDYIKDVPAGVTAQLIPKTLFGEKYVALIPPENLTGQSLRAGDVITKAEVPIEVEALLNDLYPLLEAVDPASLSYTLTAVSTALEGRGAKLGDTLVTLNDYLKKTEPDVPQLIDDLKALGTVADGYADAMPQLGRLLRNVVVTGDTVVAKKAQLTAFFDEGTALSNTLTDFVAANGDNLVALADEGRPILETVAKYSGTFPCFLGALHKMIPRLDDAFRENTLHINLEVIPKQPDAYADNENASTPSREVINSTPEAQPTCLDLEDINKGIEKYGQRTDAGPYPGPDASVYKLIGLKSSHGKFGTDADYNRATASGASLQELVQPSTRGIDSPGQRSALNAMLAASLGMSAKDVPDIGSLLVSPIIRGSEVTFSEAD